MTTTALEENPVALELPAGTRLVARLQSVVNSAIKTPIVAAIEYNYEKDGQIVVPAGAKVLGTLQQADRSGNVAIHFDALQLPDGATQKIDAAAMSLSFGPLKGNVSGRKTGTNFLVRTFTGLGQWRHIWWGREAPTGSTGRCRRAPFCATAWPQISELRETRN